MTVKPVGFRDMYLSFPNSLSQSNPITKPCASISILASTVQSNTVLIKAHHWFESFASLCSSLELWNKRWWEIAEIRHNTLFFGKMQTYLFKCSWKLPGRYSQMLIETLRAPKVVFRKKGRLQSVKNVVRKLPELYRNLPKRKTTLSFIFWIYNIALYVCGQSRFFTLYLEFFQVHESLQWLKKKKKKKAREWLDDSICFLRYFKQLFSSTWVKNWLSEVALRKKILQWSCRISWLPRILVQKRKVNPKVYKIPNLLKEHSTTLSFTLLPQNS